MRSMLMQATRSRRMLQRPISTILQAQAAIDGIEGGDPDHFMNQDADIVVLVEFRAAAVEAKLVSGKYDPTDPEGTAGSFLFTGTGSAR